MGRKSYWRKEKEKRIAQSKKANAAKEQKRLKENGDATEVGFCFFGGPAFGGCHVMRLSIPDGEEKTLLVEFDGAPHKPHTLRGIRALLARRLSKVTGARG